MGDKIILTTDLSDNNIETVVINFSIKISYLYMIQCLFKWHYKICIKSPNKQKNHYPYTMNTFVCCHMFVYIYI